MTQLSISSCEEGQRLLRYLEKYMPLAPRSFFYKMIRKKNITVNGKKAEADTRLCSGDTIRLFLSDDTINGFQKMAQNEKYRAGRRRSEQKQNSIVPDIVYENDDVICLNKPAGLLSQPDHTSEASVVGFLLEHVGATAGFRPGICSRLDRNTSGLIMGGKSMRALQQLNAAFASHSLGKYYICVVEGDLRPNGARKKDKSCPERAVTEDMSSNNDDIWEEDWSLHQAWLYKNRDTNKSHIYDRPAAGAVQIKTGWRALARCRKNGRSYTLLLVRLYTGKSHQIRAMLAHKGYPLAGDIKYGGHNIPAATKGKSERGKFRSDKDGMGGQLLHCFALTIPNRLCTDLSIGTHTLFADPPAGFADLFLHLGQALIIGKQLIREQTKD